MAMAHTVCVMSRKHQTGARKRESGAALTCQPAPPQHADAIADLVRSNPVTVIIGETGSGKTTQISQILLDHGLVPENTRIGVTQPRRVAAVSVARRVAEERGGHVGEEVGYAVRFEEATSPSTRIKYLADGTLLR